MAQKGGAEGGRTKAEGMREATVGDGLKSLAHWERWVPKQYARVMPAEGFHDVQPAHSQGEGRGMVIGLTMADNLKYVADVAADEHTADEFRRRYTDLYYELNECLRLLRALGHAQVAWQRTLPGQRAQDD